MQSHRTNTVMGAGSGVVRRFLLTEDGEFSMPARATILHSEVVVDSEDTEILQVWVLVPSVNTLPDEGQTIYTNTVVHDEDQEFREHLNNLENDPEPDDGEEEYNEYW
jgi:hypothetical protein